MKYIITVSDGQNEARGETKATTEGGWVKAAKRIWPYAGPANIRLIVWSMEGNQSPIYEVKTWID